MSKLKSKRVLKSLAAMSLALVLAFCGAGMAAAESLSELRQQQNDLQAQKEQNDARLAQLKDDTANKKAYRDGLYEQIDIVQKELDVLREKIDGLNKQIAEAEDAIADKQKSIDKNMDLLKERIKALYVSGDASNLAIILDSRNLMDYTEKSTVLQAVASHDQLLIDQLTDEMREIEDELGQISADKEEVSENKKELESKSAELSELYDEAQQLVVDAENEEATALANSEILGSQMEENEAAIKELEDQIKQQQAASGGGSAGNLGGGGYVGSGNFIWPMPGYTYLTCYFGDGGHRGIDIAGGGIYGKAIIAADGGTVEYAGWNDSYGYCVFINHGNGYETRYAHMSALGTSTGATVGQGDIIGYVGSTGNSTGPHLHFEVISGGGLTNPMGYF